MSGSVIIPSNKSALCKYVSKNTNYSTGDTFEVTSGNDRILVGYDASGVPSAAKDKRITGVELYVYGYNILNVHGFPLRDTWNEATVCYANKPSEGSTFELHRTLDFASAWEWKYIPISGTYLKGILQYGASFGKIYSVPENGQISNSRHATNAPYLIVYYGDDSPVSGVNSDYTSPKSGYIPKNESRTFRWGISQDGCCIDDVTVVSSKFRWKESGGSATEVNCGTNTYYTLAGASIAADSILWQFEVVDSLGTTVTSDWYTLSTVEATSTAVALEPVNTMVDGSSPMLFRWEHLISTGTSPTESNLQYSQDGSTWTTFATISGSATFAEVQNGTLPTGNVLWRVRTFNTENVAGTWSESASIFVINAPDAPVVSAEQTPRPLISWQSSGQEGYQIRIQGVWESGSIYGTASSKKCPVIIPDGDYSVQVRVVNEYGLWSDWGSAPLTVANSAGAAITLTVSASDSIYLSWTTSGTYERYLVQRDGMAIAVTETEDYTDQTAVGDHRYCVLGIQTGSDNYGLSNTVLTTLEISVNSITDLETGDTLELPYSTSQIREERIDISHEVSTIHVSGADYPVAEVSKWKDKSLDLEAAFTEVGNCKRLEAMLGHLVCVKAKNEESCVGILPSLRKMSSAFWVMYSLSITQVKHFEEVEL